MLTHIVLIKLDDEDAIDEVVRRARSLQSAIDVAIDLEAGRDVVGAAQSYDLAFIVRLLDQEALATFAQHPAHLAFADLVHGIGNTSAAVAFNDADRGSSS